MSRLFADRCLAVAHRLLTFQRHSLVKALIRNGTTRDRLEIARRSLERG